MKKLIFILFCLAFSTFVNAQTLPATYTKTTVMGGLRYPCDFDWTPDGRYLVTSKGDNSFPAVNAYIKIYSAAGALLGTFYDLTDSVDSDFERGLLGIAVDPNFAVNHYVYAYYNYRNPSQTILADRIVRFTEVSNVGTAPTVIFNLVYATSAGTYPGNHFGGIIRFRPSEPTKIYIQLGDLAYQQTNPTLNYANKLNKPYGKILRINSDGTIPTDNPFYDDGNPATLNDDRIWTYGNRNMFGMCFNPVTDSMYSAENGLNTWDEFNIVHKGGNYGWATCEGMFLNGSTSSPCTVPGAIAPLATWGAPVPSVVGPMYYTSSLMPEFTNHVLVADNDNGIIYDLTMGNAPAYDIVTSKTSLADITTSGGLTTLRQGVEGCIYAMKGGYTTAGAIYKICPAGMNVSMLDETNNDLGQSYPNPTNGNTQVDFNLAQDAYVTMNLFDATGKLIKVLYGAQVQTGKHTIELSGLNEFADGSYFYKMEVKQGSKLVYSQTRSLVVIQ